MPNRFRHRRGGTSWWLVGMLASWIVLALAAVAISVPALRLPVAVLLVFCLVSVLILSSEAVVLTVVGWGMVRGIPSFASLNENALLSVFGRPISTVGASLIALLAFVALRCGIVLVGHRRHSGGNRLPFLLILLAGISLLWSGPARGEGVRWLGYLTIMGGLFLLVAYDIAPSPRRRVRFVAVLLMFLISFCASSLVSRNMLDVSEDIRFQDSRGARLKGIADSPNVLAGTVAIFGSVAIALLFTRKVGWRWHAAAIVTLAVSVPVTLLTGSRSGLVGVTLAVGCALLITIRSRYLLFAGIALGLIAAAFVAPTIIRSWGTLVASPFDETLENWQTATTRFIIWRSALTEIVTPSVVPFGSGAGTTDAWCQANPSCHDAGGVHSDVLRTFIDLGVAGIAVVLSMLGRIVLRGWKLARANGVMPMDRALALAAVCAVVAIAPRLLWDLLFNAQVAWFLLIVVGLMPGRIAEPGARVVMDELPTTTA